MGQSGNGDRLRAPVTVPLPHFSQWTADARPRAARRVIPPHPYGRLHRRHREGAVHAARWSPSVDEA